MEVEVYLTALSDLACESPRTQDFAPREEDFSVRRWMLSNVAVLMVCDFRTEIIASTVVEPANVTSTSAESLSKLAKLDSRLWSCSQISIFGGHSTGDVESAVRNPVKAGSSPGIDELLPLGSQSHGEPRRRNWRGCRLSERRKGVWV